MMNVDRHRLQLHPPSAPEPYPARWSIEYEWLRSDRPDATEARSVVLLHHGLGSVSTWGSFPRRVAAALELPVLCYSRFGYGRSTAADRFPWPVEFMHRAATHELHPLLRRLGIRKPILVGHSDGASIALLYAATGLQPAPSAIALIAPHVFVEPETIAGARRAVRAYEHGSLRKQLARHHADPDSAFGGWSGVWLRPDFRDWNIESRTAAVRCPLSVVQGDADEYGTLAQLRAIERRYQGRVAAHVLSGCGHDPARERPAQTLQALLALASR